MSAGLFELSVDIQGADSLTQFDPQMVSRFMASQAEYVRSVWAEAVTGRQLTGMTRAVDVAEYARAITIQQVGAGNFQVITNYDGAMRIEQGYAPYDMKTSLLGSPKARTTLDGNGRYITVPFRQFTQAKGGGIRPSATESSTMPADVHLYTKLHGRFGGNEEWQTKLMNGGMSDSYTWQAGRLEGLTKTQTSGGATRYFTFRRISTMRTIRLDNGRTITVGSNPNSWIHPGQIANPVTASVESAVRPVITARLQEFIDSMSSNQ